VYGTPDQVLELLHYIDHRASGEVATPEVLAGSAGARKRFLQSSLIEEAIRSSQLEGAATSRKVARDMLRSGRPPRTHGERMILNNFRALEFIREQVGEPLTPGLIFALHRIVSEGTSENPNAAGRLQRPDEDRVSVFDLTGEILHVPPPAEQLPDRLDELCRFANGEGADQGFLHPVIRAILLHFWVGFDHPFEDGNGRTARALFYWSMKRSGYRLTEYLSISRILGEAPGQYVSSYLYTESDERDTTYFLLYQLEVIRRSIEELYAYLASKTAEIREVEQIIRQSRRFNHRQLALLADAVRHADRQYTFASHARSHDVTYQTARTDLLELRELHLLRLERVGRKFLFSPASDLAERLGEN
jgi:Fic family protein